VNKCLLLAAIVVLGISNIAHADLINRGGGTSAHGTYNLIYDTDRNITWYDYTNSQDTWWNQVDWASNLSVTFDGQTFINWRLPETVDGVYSYKYKYDSSATAGFNITSSELGHLYYTELGNLGMYDTNGHPRAAGTYGLINSAPFQNLLSNSYWSGTEHALTLTPDAWIFSTSFGNQYIYTQGLYLHALAVHDGDVAAAPLPAPEPTTWLLLGSGLVGLVAFRKVINR